MKVVRAIVVGVIGAAIVYLIVLLGGLLSGHEADLCLVLGASITAAGGVLAWLAGAVTQLVIAAITALVYAAVFEWVTRRAGAVVGVMVGVAHVVFAGIAVGFLPGERLINASIPPPGAFMEYRGLLVIAAFCAAHLVFGTFVGALYGRPVHRIDWRAATWHEVSL
jgi:hypothetical protein